MARLDEERARVLLESAALEIARDRERDAVVVVREVLREVQPERRDQPLFVATDAEAGDRLQGFVDGSAQLFAAVQIESFGAPRSRIEDHCRDMTIKL